MAENHDSTQGALTRFVINAAKIVALPATAVTAWFSGDVMTRNALYKNYARHGFFGDSIRSNDGVQGTYSRDVRQIVRDTYEQKIKAATTPKERSRLVHNAKRYHVIKEEEMPSVLEKLGVNAAEFKGIAVTPLMPALKDTGTKSRLAHAKETYRAEIREFFTDLDMKGMRDYFRELTRNQKTEAAVFVASTAAITLGALLTVVSLGKERQEKLRERSEGQHSRH